MTKSATSQSESENSPNVSPSRPPERVKITVRPCNELHNSEFTIQVDENSQIEDLEVITQNIEQQSFIYKNRYIFHSLLWLYSLLRQVPISFAIRDCPAITISYNGTDILSRVEAGGPPIMFRQVIPNTDLSPVVTVNIKSSIKDILLEWKWVLLLVLLTLAYSIFANGCDFQKMSNREFNQ